jgi:hypothetical protein
VHHRRVVHDVGRVDVMAELIDHWIDQRHDMEREARTTPCRSRGPMDAFRWHDGAR